MKKEIHPFTPTPMFDGVWPSAASVMPAWIAGMPGPQDASEHIHVNLMGSGSPCRNDELVL